MNIKRAMGYRSIAGAGCKAQNLATVSKYDEPTKNLPASAVESVKITTQRISHPL